MKQRYTISVQGIPGALFYVFARSGHGALTAFRMVYRQYGTHTVFARARS